MYTTIFVGVLEVVVAVAKGVESRKCTDSASPTLCQRFNE
jgi:hypothetical protein